MRQYSWASPTRNEIIEEIQWQKQSSGKKNKNEPKNIITVIEDRITVIEDANSTRKRDTKDLQKKSKRPLVVTNKHPENQDVFSSSKL